MKKVGKILIGCFLIVVFLCILGAVFGGVLIRKLISGAISQRTGVQVNVDNISQGKLTYTDPKTGATLNIGGAKIPDSFPKDFPIYPGAIVTSSLTGDQGGEGNILSAGGNGYWLTLTTPDDTSKVITYYQTQLVNYKWSASETTQNGTGKNWAVGKGNMSGYITIEKTSGNNDTSILITLSQDSPIQASPSNE